MSYSTLYQQVLIKLNPIHPQNSSQRNVSPTRSRSHTGSSPRSEREIRKSRSAGEGLATSRHCPDKQYETHEDLRYLLIPAIMKVEKERMSRSSTAEKKKAADSGVSSSVRCGLLPESFDDTRRSKEPRPEQDLSESSGNSPSNTQPSDSESLPIQSRHSSCDEDDQFLQLSSSDHDDSSRSNETDVKSDEISISSSNDGQSQSNYTKYEDEDSDRSNYSKCNEFRQSVSIKDNQRSHYSRSKSSSSRYVQSSPSKSRKRDRSRYNSSSLQTSEIPPSPDDASRGLDDDTSDPLTGGKNLTQKMRLLEVAERAVQTLLEEVLAVEARQETERRNITNGTERLEAEQRDARANEEYVRAVLAGRAVRTGTLEAAYLYQLWEAVKTDRRANRRGITFDVWLKEKREKFQEEKERLEKEQKEKEEARKERKERARIAFEKWCEVAKKRPKPLPFMIFVTGKDTKKYIRPGTFFNPNPWVDILEEERKNKVLSEVTSKSTDADSPQLYRSLPMTRSDTTQSVEQHATINFENMFPKVRDRKLQRHSTYDKLVDFYTDLLKRCTVKRHHSANRHGRNDDVLVSKQRPMSKSKTYTIDSGSVRSNHEMVSNSNLPLCDIPNVSMALSAGQASDIKKSSQ